MSLFKKKKEKKKEKEEEITSSLVKDSYPYQIIKEPIITEKGTNLAEQRKYIFKVFSKANKIEVKRAIEKLYNVKVKNVRIINVIGKKRQIGRFEGWKSGFKKAIVTLKEGSRIEYK